MFSYESMDNNGSNNNNIKSTSEVHTCKRTGERKTATESFTKENHNRLRPCPDDKAYRIFYSLESMLFSDKRGAGKNRIRRRKEN
jgi:hypothetical protein